MKFAAFPSLPFTIPLALLAISIGSLSAHGRQTDSVTLQKRGPNAPTVTIHRDDRVATLDLDYVVGDPWTPFDIEADGLGPVGYRISWIPLRRSLTQFTRKITSLRRTQIQPLNNDEPYFVRVDYVNRFGQLVGDFSSGIVRGGSSARVDLLRRQMTGFFDDFNSPAGLPDERKWNTTFSKVNDPNLQGFFINHQFHTHTLVGTLAYGFGDRGQATHRIRNPLVVSENETRRIVFDLDGVNVGSRSIWYLDLIQEESEMTTHFTLGGGAGFSGHPAPGLRFSLKGQEVAVWTLNQSGEQMLIEMNNLLDFEGVQNFPNVRRKMEILLDDDHVTMLMDGQVVLDSNLGTNSLSPGEYTVHWTAFGYNTMKVNMPYFVLHWDNFGFDGPMPTHTVHNYRTQVAGTDYVQSDNFAPQTVQVNIPDDLTPSHVGAIAEARLVFTRQMKDWQYAAWNPSDLVSVNGVDYSIPAPVSNTSPPLVLDQLINTNAIYSTYVPLGTVGPGGNAPLIQGNNNITFESESCGFHNIHVEIKYRRGSEPAYTPPQDIHSIPVHHDFPKVGLPARITRIADIEVDRNVWNMDDPANFNATVSGTIEIGALVNGDEFYGPTTLYSDYVSPQLAGSGENPGIKKVELWIRPDGGDENSAVLVNTVQTDLDVNAPQFIHKFNLDTSQFSNGDYELTLVAEDSREILSIPDFGGVGRQAGSPAALNGFYFPLHVTINN